MGSGLAGAWYRWCPAARLLEAGESWDDGTFYYYSSCAGCVGQPCLVVHSHCIQPPYTPHEDQLVSLQPRDQPPDQAAPKLDSIWQGIVGILLRPRLQESHAFLGCWFAPESVVHPNHQA